MRKTKTKEGEHPLIGFIALCQSRSSLVLQTKRGILRHPASVLAPESALGSLPSVALSSAQAGRILTANRNLCPGRRFIWPVLEWPHMAGFEVATEELKANGSK